MRRLALRAIAVSGLLGTTVLASGAHAQLVAPAPVRPTVDGNGVDLFSGRWHVTGPVLSMGQSQGLSYYRFNAGNGWTDNVIAYLNKSGSTMTVSLAGESDRFTISGSNYINQLGNGATLVFNGTTLIYTYTRADGTVVRFDKNKLTETPYYSNEGRAIDMTSPSGDKLTYSYGSQVYCKSYKPSANGSICMMTGTIWRLGSVRNSYGYRLGFTYSDYEYYYEPTEPQNQPDFAEWSKVVGVTMSNLAVTGSSTPGQSFGETEGSGYVERTITDAMGRITKYRDAYGGVSTVTLPGSTSADITVAYSGARVTSVATPAGTTSYAASDASGVRTVTVTDPLSHATTYRFDIASERLTQLTNATNQTTTMQYDGSGRLTRVTEPEGNYTQLTYDGRGNITEKRLVSKTPGTPADIVTTAGYDATCANAATCNQPNWTRDAAGNQTDYTYDSSHGGMLTVTSPAPSGGAVRPQVRTSYSSLQAYFRNASGSIVASGEPVTLVTGVSSCQTASSCTGAADEVKTTVSYGPQTAGVGNNLLPVSISKGAGDNSLTATTAYTYDSVGNLTQVDGPLAGTADTTRTLYNADREVVGTISADPDGAGALPNQAQRRTIDARGLVTRIEVGTTAGQSDAAWSGFAAAQAVDVVYDSARRAVSSKLSGGGTGVAMTQASYDAAGRVDCTAVRMNPAVYGSLPASACTLSTIGAGGPDRITRIGYDASDRPVASTAGYGTADAATEEMAYTANGRVAWIEDARDNRTAYGYDGFDRTIIAQFPSTTVGAHAANGSDFESYGYDARSLLTSVRDRAGGNHGMVYDALGRMTSKTSPNSEPTQSMTYDLLGRLTSVNLAGDAVWHGYTYDALGRQLTATNAFGTVGSSYDLAGRRTRITYPDGFYVDYDTDVTGNMTRIRENGATSGVGVLATFGYDGLGRRTSLTYGNGVTQATSFDSVSRLAALTDNLAGTSDDVTASFTYNSASQILSRAHTGNGSAGRAMTGLPSVSRGYTVNGLNQYGWAGPAQLGYDTRGNLTVSAIPGRTDTFGYSSENMMTGMPSAAVGMSYDPLGRLKQLTSPTSNTRFLYDGLDMIAEYDSNGQMTRRYVHGPGVDEPLVWYEGGTTSDRRFLLADERGSVVAVTNSSGGLIGTNRYDEYGIPAATNIGRFQYTGQTWLPEVGLYYYKARMYSPTLGRFMQTDPIGYADGLNWYNYVGSDPVNGTDPSGTTEQEPKMCTGSILRSTDCGFVSGLLENGQDAQASRMNFENWAAEQGWTLGGKILDAKSAIAWIDKHGGWRDAANNWVTREMWESSQSFMNWWNTRTQNDISGTSMCWKACGPNMLDPVQIYSPREQAETLAGVGAIYTGGLLAPEAGPILFSRGTGLLNSNNYLRIGQGWKGSAQAGRQVFRLSIGHRSWGPPFPIHIP